MPGEGNEFTDWSDTGIRNGYGKIMKIISIKTVKLVFCGLIAVTLLSGCVQQRYSENTAYRESQNLCTENGNSSAEEESTAGSGTDA